MTTKANVIISALMFVLTAGVYAAAPDPLSPQSGAAGSSAPQGTTSAAGTAQADLAILNLKAGEIAGREVYNSEGKALGKVDIIGRDRDTGTLSAIVLVGGFLGLGGSKVAIPVEQLTLKDNKLTASTALSKKELRKEAANYKEKKYESVANDTTLSQVAPKQGGSTAGGAGVVGGTVPGSTSPGALSFQGLDSDADGYISQDEARADQTITSRWSTIDKNSDGKLDRSEFSAFEALTRPDARDQMRESAPPSGNIPPPSQVR